jgi:hypothetical protein
MNLFRSEEHVRNWSGFKANTEEGVVPLIDMARSFSGDFFKRRLDADYFSRSQEYVMELLGVWKEMGSFWQM